MSISLVAIAVKTADSETLVYRLETIILNYDCSGRGRVVVTSVFTLSMILCFCYVFMICFSSVLSACV